MITITAMQCSITTKDAEATEAMGEKIGQRLQGGEVIELVSDLGGGKTTFVRGLARGFGSPNKVASPTFTISKVYQAGKRQIHHFDFYRLQGSGIVAHELEELVGLPEFVVVIEWAKVVQQVLPTARLTINIQTMEENTRHFVLECPDSLAYLAEGIC